MPLTPSGRSPPPRSFRAASVRALLIMLVLVPLGACARFVDTEAARLCRSILPAINPEGSRIDVTSIEEPRRRDRAGASVVVGYRAAPAGEASRARHATCVFAAPDGRPDALELAALATEEETLGPLRIHLLNRHWIASGLAASSDPSPAAPLGPVPRLPKVLAVALQQILATLPSIAIYMLLAAAYALIYGLVGRINLAFGELAMLAGYGAFLGVSLVAGGGTGLLLAAAFGVGLSTCLVHAAALGRFVFGPIVRGDANQSGQHVLIATIGLSIAWSETVRLMQGSGNRWLAPLFNRPIAIARSDEFLVTMTPMAFVVFAVAGAAAISTLMLLARSRFGRSWRAIADDPIAASLFGIDPQAVLLRTMLLAAALTGIGGVLMALFYGGVGHSGGLAIGLKALIAAVIGGIGSVAGALLGGLVIGLAETAWSAAFPIEYRDPAIFALLALVLALRPGGLLGWQDLAPRRV